MLGACADSKTGLAADIVGDSGAVFTVVHHQSFYVRYVGHHKLVETIGKNIAGPFVATVTDLRFFPGSLEATALTAINTFGLAPAVRDFNPLVAVEVVFVGTSLLDNLSLGDADGRGQGKGGRSVLWHDEK